MQPLRLKDDALALAHRLVKLPALSRMFLRNQHALDRLPDCFFFCKAEHPRELAVHSHDILVHVEDGNRLGRTLH